MSFNLPPIPNSWKEALGPELSKPYFKDLVTKLSWEYTEFTVYPPGELIFNALELTPLDKVRVVILGQDPYHEPGQAMGLAFSVPEGVKIPPSLRNIYKEMVSDLGCKMPSSGDLSPWARQGVLLLNTSLTVRAHEAGSHSKFGWSTFTDAVIRAVDKRDLPTVYFLWGKHAQAKEDLIRSPKALVLKSHHPSPLSANRGFFGNGHFSKAREFLEQH